MGKKQYPMYEVEITKNYPSGISTHIDWRPNTNIIETSTSLLIEMELPGVNKADISISLQRNNELIVKGIKKQPVFNEEQTTYYLFEREFGTFYKKIVIDFAVETDEIKSAMDGGVLVITIPKKKVKKISVDIK